jgi:acetylornithine deacetylase
MKDISALHRRVAELINVEQLVQDLQVLVSIDSLTGSEEAAQHEMAALMKRAGLRVVWSTTDLDWAKGMPNFPGVEVKRSSLPIVAGHLGGQLEGPRVLLVAHMDVVPSGDRSQWSTGPFDPVVKDGRMYGRGACDMKGGAIAALAAIRALHAVGQPLHGEAVLLSVPGEEDGGAGMFAAIQKGYIGDAAIIPEPTSLDIVTVQSGAISFALKVPGRAAHAAMRREGVSAIDKFYVLLDALKRNETERNRTELRPELEPLGLPYPTSIGKIAGGEWSSTVADQVVAEGRYGVRVGQTTEEAAEELRSVISYACEGDSWLRHNPATVTIHGGRFGAAEIRSDDPLPTSLAEAVELVTGKQARFTGVSYGSDMRLLINQGKTPTVLFGPGDVRVAHSPNEYVAIDEVVTCAQVLAVWLLRTLGGELDVS